MSQINKRTIELFGEADYQRLSCKTVAVIGLGGVGGTALECLARTGIKKLVIVDYDIVDITNLNRQILYVQDDVGKLKTEVAQKRIAAINPNIEVVAINCFIDEHSISSLQTIEIDYVIDAIDSLKAKIALHNYCHKGNIPIIVCLGTGRKFNSEDVVITTLDQTNNDPLARRYRALLRKENLDLSQVDVVFSKEKAQDIKEKNPSSYMVVPSIAGLKLAGYVINKLKGR